MSEEKKAKELLEKIRRQPSNKACVNCNKEAILGHGDICVKFQTFVCHICKSAHQSFSHRCKSVSLSNWTLQEVQQLMDSAGGGNAHARSTWLGQLGDRLILRPDNNLESVKNFVNDAYNYKRYWKEPSDAPLPQAVDPPHSNGFKDAGPSTQRTSRVRPTTNGTSSTSAQLGALTPPTKSVSGASSSNPNSNANFFDFDAFGKGPTSSGIITSPIDSFGDFVGASPPSSTTASRPLAPPSPPPSLSGFDDHQAHGWEPFVDIDAPFKNEANSNSSSAFGFISASPASTAPPSNVPVAHPIANPIPGFDLFGIAPPITLTPTTSSSSSSTTLSTISQAPQAVPVSAPPRPVMMMPTRSIFDDRFASIASPSKQPGYRHGPPQMMYCPSRGGGPMIPNGGFSPGHQRSHPPPRHMIMGSGLPPPPPHHHHPNGFPPMQPPRGGPSPPSHFAPPPPTPSGPFGGNGVMGGMALPFFPPMSPGFTHGGGPPRSSQQQAPDPFAGIEWGAMR